MFGLDMVKKPVLVQNDVSLGEMCVQWLLSLLKSFLITDVIRTHRQKVGSYNNLVRQSRLYFQLCILALTLYQ